MLSGEQSQLQRHACGLCGCFLCVKNKIKTPRATSEIDAINVINANLICFIINVIQQGVNCSV